MESIQQKLTKMTFKELLIKFQNNAESDFHKQKSLKNVTNYILALIVFFSSTLIAGFSFPIRYILKKAKSDKPKILDINSQNFEKVIKNNDLTILNFTAHWCGPCMLMSNILNKFAQSQNNVLIGKINIDTNRKLTTKFNVRGVPQFLLIKHGQEIKRHIGPMTLKQLEDFHK